MPKIKVNDLTMNYDQQGSGEPLILIPFLAADVERLGSRSRNVATKPTSEES